WRQKIPRKTRACRLKGVRPYCCFPKKREGCEKSRILTYPPDIAVFSLKIMPMAAQAETFAKIP
ncbi:hypothetical protein, partial [Neisseria dentiae]|uniref:hypothetical protein n=1 Tax=Neisseria dentiae TaxID=194197 RepID=UPI00359F922F